MTTAAKSGIGASVSVGDGASPESFTAIAEIASFTGPNVSSEEVDVTTLDSVGGFKQVIAGLKEGGSIDLELLYTGTSQQDQLRDDVSAGTSRNYQVSFPTSPATTATFEGLPSQWSMTAEPNSPVSASVSIKIAGNITWA